MTPEVLGTVGIYLSAVMATVGLVGYAMLARFWRSRGGWHVFWFMLVLAWVLDLAALRNLIGFPAWLEWLRLGTFAVGMPVVLGWRCWIIFDLQLGQWRREKVAYGGGRQSVNEEEKDAV